MKAKAWCSEPLLEWTPERLPGYAEAVATLARGESLFPKREKRPAAPRRPLSELQERRERLAAQLSQFGTQGPVDTAAARLDAAGMRQHYRHTDAQLERFVRMSNQLAELDSKILRHPDAA